MKPTMHLRFRVEMGFENGGDVFALVIPTERRILQQFWEVAANESDITLPRQIGPDGVEGRWRDVPSDGSSV